MSGNQHYVSGSPACPFAPHLALLNRVLGCGVYTVLLRTPLQAILWCDFALRSESIGCADAFLPQTYRFRSPSTSHRRANFKNFAL
jgi:hypothetical protein